jgi:nucleotide-binding universal stress UspA family protein
MIKIARILWPVDFSEHARHALQHAVAIARWYDSTITALHVHSGYRVVGDAPEFAMVEYDDLTTAEERRLTSEVERFIEKDGEIEVPLNIVVATGAPAREVLKHADGMPADLVIMGTHGRSGFERLILGSVTERVLRKAPCPVMSVPPRGAEGAAPSAPLFKRILCPVDFSDCSMRALAYAMSLAQEADAHLIAVHVLEFPEDAAERLKFPIVNLEEYRRRSEQESQERLEQAIPETVRAYCRVETQVVTGRAYRETLRIAEEQQADLIVIGVRGRGAVDRLFFGSTTNHVVRQASCPVLTMRQP